MPSEIPPPILVDSSMQLSQFLRDVENCSEIAVDTEADSFYSYREKVCLIQVSSPAADYIIDPLANVELSALAPVLASDSILKVFHDAEYDVQLLKSAGISEMRRIFDTRVAVSLLGNKSPGLANVLKDRYGIQLNKSLQRSDWSQRPLSIEQLEYARHDTRYLLQLARDIKPQLKQRDIWELFLYECERVAATPSRERNFNADECIQIKGCDRLDANQLASLRELFIERERLAEAADAAPFRIITNELLLVLALLSPRNARELDQVRALPPKLKQQFGPAALGAIARARQNGPWIPPPRVPRPPDDELAALDRLKKWRTIKSEKLNIDATGILNRRTLEFLAKERPASLELLEKAPGLNPWQFQRFGAEIIKILSESNKSWF
ncbi:MAG: ribonuclease D [Planctomycetota bacterium]